MVSQKPAGSTSRRKQEHHQYVTPGPESQSLIPATWQFAVVLPIISEPASDFEQLEDISSTIIRKIINEKNEDGDLLYQTVYEDGSQEWLSFDIVLGTDGGNEALNAWETRAVAEELSDDDDDDAIIISQQVKISSDESSEEGRDGSEDGISTSRSRRTQRSTRQAISKSRKSVSNDNTNTRSSRSTRSNNGKVFQQLSYNQLTDEDDEVGSDLQPRRKSLRGNGEKKVVFNYVSDDEDTSSRRRSGRKRQRDSGSESEQDSSRRSGRTKRSKGSMREVGEDEIEVYEAEKKTPKIVHSKEVFEEFNDDNEFVMYHMKQCDSCGDPVTKLKGALVYCQGCSFAYHKGCLGPRSMREHLVTKVAEDRFLLQCRHCVARHNKKDDSAPHHNKCSDCCMVGQCCEPFRPLNAPKTSNGEATPEAEVPPQNINNFKALFFRCVTCHRGYHYEHLPPRTDRQYFRETAPERRRIEYEGDWSCIECHEYRGQKVNRIVAWRPKKKSLEEDSVDVHVSEVETDDIEFLVIFGDESYFSAKWFAGAWIWGFAARTMIYAFKKNNPYPKWTDEDAIPEDYLRVDIVFEVVYTSIVPLSSRSETVDRARIGEVDKVLVKFKGLNYEDAAWITPPSEEDTERFTDFKVAYDTYVKGTYIRLPKRLQLRLNELREKNFTTLELKKQPKYLSGGQLKDYQKEGINWLYYKWFSCKNAMLADEMGLGKTIQIIGFLSVIQREHMVWPFLIVAPHSTVPNWIREIRKWAPHFRVVAFYGSAAARNLTRKHELFQSDGELKCHIVVTSYQTPVDDGTILKGIPWQALIVDEGQRLKSEDSLLYKALSSFKINHKVLLTGTPLQNNTRELFNLLQFLDPVQNKAERLEVEFGEITKENLLKLHELIKPYFLRRTKKGALKELPPISEMIVPITLTNLQRKLYGSVMEKNAELIKALMYKGSGGSRMKERAKLNNIMMQLRKITCHPFVYSSEVEDKNVDPSVMDRNLIDAGAKLKLLEIMLPKLHQRGHRVLMFSQFLDMLDVAEDFLDTLGLPWLRLDGSNSTAEKQRLIDKFNAPDSPYFAFLLSTKAGGVGINLATADIVIIMDPDFNPHQDLQAISRAHRIGQKNKVLVFHLMTQSSVEERILQVSKKKLSLDHLIIQSMKGEGVDEDEEAIVDVESILRHGAEALMSGEYVDIKYDSTSVDKLLDKCQTAEAAPEAEGDGSAEAQFSFARVWANDTGDLTGPLAIEDDEEQDYHPEVWDEIIQRREAQRAADKAAQEAELGRGHRRSGRVIVYQDDGVDGAEGGADAATDGALSAEPTPVKPRGRPRKTLIHDDDTDFYASAESGSDSDVDFSNNEDILKDLQKKQDKASRSHILDPSNPIPSLVPKLSPQGSVTTPTVLPSPAPPVLDISPQRSNILIPQTHQQYIQVNNGMHLASFHIQHCMLCYEMHRPGHCKYRSLLLERCPLCGIAHYGDGPNCPHLGSETQINMMLDALRQSNERSDWVEEAKKYLRSRKGALQKRKKEQIAKKERTERQQMSMEQQTNNADLPIQIL